MACVFIFEFAAADAYIVPNAEITVFKEWRGFAFSLRRRCHEVTDEVS